MVSLIGREDANLESTSSRAAGEEATRALRPALVEEG
jgi:hypothetical protein